MKRLWVQLSLAFLLVAWASIAALAFVVQQSTDIIFRHYVMERDMMGMSADLVGELESYYATHGSWDGADVLLTTHNTMGNGMMGGGPGGGCAAEAGCAYPVAARRGRGDRRASASVARVQGVSTAAAVDFSPTPPT